MQKVEFYFFPFLFEDKNGKRERTCNLFGRAWPCRCKWQKRDIVLHELEWNRSKASLSPPFMQDLAIYCEFELNPLNENQVGDEKAPHFRSICASAGFLAKYFGKVLATIQQVLFAKQ